MSFYIKQYSQPIMKLLGAVLVSALCFFQAQAASATPSKIIPNHASEINISWLQKQLSEHDIVRGNFEQSRNMVVFNKPLMSSGHFLLSKQKGLLWQQTKPFAVSLTLTQDKLRQQFAQQAPELMSAKNNPMVFYFSHLFLSLFKGDTQALTQEFDLKITGNTNNWQLALTPKKAPLNLVFSSIQLTGGDYINTLKLTENRGDKTQITFKQQRSIPASLTVDEQSAFNL